MNLNIEKRSKNWFIAAVCGPMGCGSIISIATMNWNFVNMWSWLMSVVILHCFEWYGFCNSIEQLTCNESMRPSIEMAFALHNDCPLAGDFWSDLYFGLPTLKNFIYSSYSFSNFNVLVCSLMVYLQMYYFALTRGKIGYITCVVATITCGISDICASKLEVQ